MFIRFFRYIQIGQESSSKMPQNPIPAIKNNLAEQIKIGKYHLAEDSKVSPSTSHNASLPVVTTTKTLTTTVTTVLTKPTNLIDGEL